MKRLDLTGERYGHLHIIGLEGKHGKNVHWNCVCDCGVKKVVSTTHLRSGHTRSCGCVRFETAKVTALKNQKHGMWKSAEFGIWSKMIARCHSPNNKKYPLYGGRGITVCDEWRKDFAAFYAHIGPRPGPEYSIDRKDGNKGYEPGNVRWATIETQNNNKRTNIFITHAGLTQTISQWARLTGISKRAISYRLKKGVPTNQIFASPNLSKFERQS